MHTFALIVLGVLFLAVPGWSIARLSGLRALPALAAGAPVTLGGTGIATWLFGMIDVPWNAATALLTWAFALAAAAAWRALVAPRLDSAGVDQTRSERSGNGDAPDGADAADAMSGPFDFARRPLPALRAELGELGSRLRILWPAIIGVVVATGWTLRSILDSLRETTGHGLASPSMLWDALWHVNSLRFIDNTGIASSTRMGELEFLNGQGTLYYPEAWHAVSTLTMQAAGAEPVVAYNVLTALGFAWLMPLGAAALAWRMAADRLDPARAALAAGAAALAAAALPALIFTAYFLAVPPFGVAAGCAGVAAVLVMSTPTRRGNGFAAALALVGAGLTHPAGAVTVAVTVLVWWAIEALPRPRRGRLADLLTLGAVAFVSLLFLAPQWLGGNENQGDEIRAYEKTIDASRVDSWWFAITQHTDFAKDVPTPRLVFLLALVGVLAFAWRRSVWLVAVWGVFVVVQTNALVPFSGFVGELVGPLGELYYNTPTRLSIVLAILVAAAAGSGVAEIAGAVVATARLVLGRTSAAGAARDGDGGMQGDDTPRAAAAEPAVSDHTATAPAAATPATAADVEPDAPTDRRLRRVAVGAALAVLIGGTVVVDRGLEQRTNLAVVMHRSDHPISERDHQAFAWLSRQPYAHDGPVFFDAAEGGGWMYALENIPTVFHHYGFAETPDVVTIWQNIQDTGENGAVDDVLARLGVRYVYISPPSIWPWQPTFPHMAVDTFRAPGLVPVYRDHEVSILAVKAGFSEEELRQVQADAPPFR